MSIMNDFVLFLKESERLTCIYAQIEKEMAAIVIGATKF